MSDIDGKDAFEMLLDRLTDAINSERTERERAQDAQHALSNARRENQDMAQRLASAQTDLTRHATGLPKLAELLNAARAALPHLTDFEGVRDRLKKAADEAGPWCDEIPF